MEKIIIESNFHIFVSQGEGRPERKAVFTKGMVVDVADIPEGQSAEAWIASGLAKAV